MENASKALIMAGEILIGMIIIGVIAYLFLTMAKPAESVSKRISQTEIDKINSYFTSLQSKTDNNGKWNITAQDVVSAINYAKEQNQKEPVQITVNVQGFSANAAQATSNQLMNFIKADTDPNKASVKYSCTITEKDYDQSTGLIKNVTFTPAN